MNGVFKKWLDEGKISHSTYMVLTEGQTKHDPEGENGLKISVLISTYRRPGYLIRMLDSIRMQHYKNCEIIIVDDASGDDTAETIDQYKSENPDLQIQYSVNEKNMEISESKRRAYRKATGDIILFTDDDDYFIDPLYFSEVNALYEAHPDCIMTIAASIKQSEKEGTYEYLGLNTPEVLSAREYLNGFMGKYINPSVVAFSLSRSALQKIHYEQLLCFNDTSLLLFGLLGNGNVYTISHAIGIYCFHGANITGNITPGFAIANMESKEDICHRAMEKGLLDNPKAWHYRNTAVTARYYLLNKKAAKEDKEVWKWMKDHLGRTEYCRFVASVMKVKTVRLVKTRIPRFIEKTVDRHD